MFIELTTFGELMRHFRERAGWGVKEAAQIAGVSRVGLWRWESDNNQPRFEKREKLYQAYDLSRSEINECENALYR